MSTLPDQPEKLPVWHWIPLVIVLAATAWLRWHLVDVPLERDEGEYAYGAQLLLEGIPPYAMLYSMKLPGIYAAYAGLLAVFGETHSGIHLGLLCLNLVTIVAMYWLGLQLMGRIGALAAAASFALLSVGSPVQGLYANAEHFVILPVVLGAALIYRAVGGRQTLLWGATGLCFGLSFIIKQHSALFIVWGACVLAASWLFNRPRSLAGLARPAAAFTGGVFLPYLLVCLLMWQAGVFEKFWFLTVQYATDYVDQISLSQGLNNLQIVGGRILVASPALWCLVAAGLASAAWKARHTQDARFLLSFALFSFMAVCPGLLFRTHYFILVLPAAALTAGFCIDVLFRALSRLGRPAMAWSLPLAIFLVAILSSAYMQRNYLLFSTPEQVSRINYGTNPFVESLEVARFLREHSQPGQTVAILGSEPQIFFYSGLHSATGYIYMYPLMELHPHALAMQEEMIREVEAAQPEFLVFVNVPMSWLPRPGSKLRIFEWLKTYVRDYRRVGLAEMHENGTRYSWGDEANRSPQSPISLEIHQRIQPRQDQQ